uniref:Uncharacterized protein n=1 Tax=Anguilla anguilla TaxID=7936 RepID=A0A0E9SAM9_ANGAN
MKKNHNHFLFVSNYCSMNWKTNCEALLIQNDIFIYC